MSKGKRKKKSKPMKIKIKKNTAKHIRKFVKEELDKRLSPSIASFLKEGVKDIVDEFPHRKVLEDKEILEALIASKVVATAYQMVLDRNLETLTKKIVKTALKINMNVLEKK